MGDIREEYTGIENLVYEGIRDFLENNGAVSMTSHSIEVTEGRMRIYHYNGCTIRMDYIGRLKTLRLRSVGENSKIAFDSIVEALDKITIQQ
jgi:hypothetical protein